MSFDPNIVAAILALIAGPIVSFVVQAIKSWLKWDGAKALGLSAGIAFGATAVYLFQSHAFSLIGFVGYGLLVFIESTGVYKFKSQ
jgi:hypothetical protein